MARSLTKRSKNRVDYGPVLSTCQLPWRVETPSLVGLPTFRVDYENKKYKLVVYKAAKWSAQTDLICWFGVLDGLNLRIQNELPLSSLSLQGIKEVLDKAEDLILSPMARLAIQCQAHGDSGHADSMAKLG